MIKPDTSIRAHIRKGPKCYVARCSEIAVVTQGSTLDETVDNLQEAVCRFLEEADLEVYGLVPNPRLVLTMEIDAMSSASA